MKKLVPFVIVALCCIWLTGCPSTTSSGKKTTDQAGKTPGTTGGEHVLKISATGSLTIKQGESNTVNVTVTREPASWDEDVTITFKNLPKGVTGPTDGKISKAS